jgi:hypothetical protein
MSTISLFCQSTQSLGLLANKAFQPGFGTNPLLCYKISTRLNNFIVSNLFQGYRLIFSIPLYSERKMNKESNSYINPTCNTSLFSSHSLFSFHFFHLSNHSLSCLLFQDTTSSCSVFHTLYIQYLWLFQHITPATFLSNKVMQNSATNNNLIKGELDDFQDMNDKLTAFNNSDMDDLFGDGQYFTGIGNVMDPTLGADILLALPFEDQTYNNYNYPDPISYTSSPMPVQHYRPTPAYNGQAIQPYNNMLLPSVGGSYAHTPNLSLDTGDEIVYRNTILGKFSNPVTPLSIIDNHKYPFDKKLTAALEAQLRKEETSAQMPAPNSDLRTRAPNGKIHKNKRPDNIRNIDAKSLYVLPDENRRLTGWAPDASTGENIFDYTEHGELMPGRQYSTKELHHYLYQHPFHWAKDAGDYKRSGLILWIQNHPADSKARYGVPGKSDKCRWDECPVKDRTIHKGFFRVAFDEYSGWYAGAEDLDPFHCAGYMHLCCLEKMLDFPELCKRLRVMPDCRVLPKEKINRMAVNRDHKQLEDICNKFILRSIDGEQPPADVTSGSWYRNTLCHSLTAYHISHQARHIQHVRSTRGGNNIDSHMGCCDTYAQGEVNKPRRKNDGPRSGGGRTKRKRSADQAFEDDADAEFTPDPNIFNFSQRSPTKRPTKRPRRQSSTYQF